MTTPWWIRRVIDFKYRRWFRFLWQRLTRGWDDSETWNLNSNVARFMLPRLKRFKELHKCHPVGITWEEWKRMLSELEWYLERVADDGGWFEDREVERMLQAERILGERFRDLWW